MNKSNQWLKSNGSNNIKQSDMGTVSNSTMAHVTLMESLPNTKETGIEIWNKVKDLQSTQMEALSKESLRKMSKMVLELSIGRKAMNTKDISSMEWWMARADSSIQMALVFSKASLREINSKR